MGRFIGIEFKKDAKAKRDPLQERKLKLIAEAGGLGIFCYPENLDDVIEMIFEIVKGELRAEIDRGQNAV